MLIYVRRVTLHAGARDAGCRDGPQRPSRTSLVSESTRQGNVRHAHADATFYIFSSAQQAMLLCEEGIAIAASDCVCVCVCVSD